MGSRNFEMSFLSQPFETTHIPTRHSYDEPHASQDKISQSRVTTYVTPSIFLLNTTILGAFELFIDPNT